MKHFIKSQNCVTGGKKVAENWLNFPRDNDEIQVASLTVIKRPIPKKSALNLDI